MINRILIRIKIVQILYSYYKSDGKNPSAVEKELFFSIEKTYDLYIHLFALSIEITRYAALRIDAKRNKLRPAAEDLNPNTRFIDNKFVAQLAVNKTLNEYLKAKKLSWENEQDIIKELYEEIIATDFYAEYMKAPAEKSYNADKDLWRTIYKKVILANEALDNSLEEQSIYWTDDIEIVASFIIKTIKRFDETKADRQELLPMFKDEEDSDFARKLLRSVLSNNTEYRELIDKHTRNWELDRIAFMDIVIMEIALAELIHFPTIPLNVTLNEYIEISKSYSTEKSATFINGVIDNIANELKKENKLIKAVAFK
ncbi:MAG: transcription antitermination factor NusB [Prevotellaceae bacterium]|nr:transcription antitermination factor NusB [Prevotellaceae bacterium]